MKITEFRAENYRRLLAVEIRPDRSLVTISGKNGAGKTSVLNAIAVALGGKELAPAEPIRKGESAAEITVTLDSGAVITRRFWRKVGDAEGYNSELKIEIGGAIRRQPQAYLSAMVGDLAFDPLQFARMKPAEQFGVLKRFVGNFDFDAAEKQTADDYAERTLRNRQAREAKASAEAIKVPARDLPEAADEGALLDELQAAMQHNQEIEQRKARREQAAEEITALDDEVEALELKLMAARARADLLRSKIEAAPPLPEPRDVADIRKRVDAAHASASVREDIKKRRLYQEAAETHADAAEELTARMQARKERAQEAIAQAKLPVPGLGLADKAVTLNDLPFEQAAGAEQLRASIAIAMRLNPTLRVMLVDEGSSLDDDSLAIVAGMAQAEDYQLWIARVSEGGDGSGFVIQEGSMAEVP